MWKTGDGAKESQLQERKWLVVTMLNKGHCFQSQQKYHKALNLLVKAKEIAKAGQSRLFAESLLALSLFYTEVRSFQEAGLYARQTLEVLQGALKEAAERGKQNIKKLSELYVRAFAQIGSVEDRMGNKYGSLNAYQKGLAIAKKHLPKEDPLRTAIGSKVQRIRSSSNVRSSCRASLSTSMQSQRTGSAATQIDPIPDFSEACRPILLRREAADPPPASL